ncbi:MFS transporter [Saccharibacillus sp. CPCC 101409]|uniref:MFS transporter n=1 Tax=Saccharibacillus sp. CPCC 101409 TaxID=3058041 RepID=UPI00267174FB|nr:MFS transporter [Saccharibacillus sp. CPCC 101409]MDO3410419.1 MFS transporter [Saccharibacillus sp. CPCC 101409]
MSTLQNKSIYPPNYWKRVVFTFCMGWAIIWVYRSMLSPIYTEIQGTIGPQTNAAMGLIASCYFFGYTALQIPSGIMVDKFGQKKVLIPGFIVFALGVISIAFAQNLTMIYIGSVLAGVGCGTYYGAAFSLTAQHVPPEKKGIATAIVNSGSALGLILGMTGSSFLVKQLHLPWQTMVFISAGLIIFLVVWFAVMIVGAKNPQNVPTAQAAKTAASDETIEPLAQAVSEESKPKKGLFRKELVASYLLYFSTCYAYYLIVTWLPKFLESERGIQGSMIGLITSMIAVAAVPGALYFASLSDKMKHNKPKIIIGLEISSVVLISVSVFVPNAGLLAGVLLMYGFLGKLAVDPVLISYITDKADSKSVASTLGVFNFFGMSSSVIAPALTGYIIDTTGSGQWGFYIGAIILLIGTVVFTISSLTSSSKKAARV